MDDASGEKKNVDSKEESSSSSASEFTDAEKNLVARMYKFIGNRWHLIAGRIPGRTAEQIE